MSEVAEPRAIPSGDFLNGGGEMGALMRAYDWSSNPLGAPEIWPQSLRLTIRLLLNTRQPMFIWWGPDLIQFYNDAYRETMGPERHPSALGGFGHECWAEIWDIIGPQIDYVLEGKGSTWDEDRLVPVTRHGRLENVWWTYGYNPIDEEGEVGGVLVICMDVTQQHLAKMALERQTNDLQSLFEQAPGFMAVLRGPDHVFELANASYRALVGNRPVLGRKVREIVPEAEGQGYFELLDEVYQMGVPKVGRRSSLVLKDPVTGSRSQLFVDFVYAPLLGSDGITSGVFVEGNDVTDHMLAEQDLRLINQELRHRVKNTLAVVGALASQSLRGADNGPMLQKFLDRLGAFAKAHDALTERNWATARIHDVVETGVAPYRTAKGKIVAAGPDLTLTSRQAVGIALAIHELATNATKYGALSADGGLVEIAWTDMDAAGASMFGFEWRESDGPPVSRPEKPGFGTKLITRILNAEFRGETELVYGHSGLVCRLTAPFDVLSSAESDGRESHLRLHQANDPPL
jgi:two-component sensor histidine kinase